MAIVDLSSEFAAASPQAIAQVVYTLTGLDGVAAAAFSIEGTPQAIGSLTMLDERGNPINKRNAFATRSVAYVRLIPPGAADTVRYRLLVPETAGDRITVRARVNHRKFSWWNTQWAFAGVRDPRESAPAVAPGYDDGAWVFTGDPSLASGKRKGVPVLPITVMAQAEASLRVGDARPQAGEVAASPALRGRWNDYGIGLLLQGDLKGAEGAFLKVTQLDPRYADGWVNVARARKRASSRRKKDSFGG